VHQGRARIAVINRAINLAIQPQASPIWSTPVDTLLTGRGDCKDYAVAKYVALLEIGTAEADVSLVILRDLTVGEVTPSLPSGSTENGSCSTIADSRWLKMSKCTE
jgi:predicted transglutaminase-like cysteine proteinase